MVQGAASLPASLFALIAELSLEQAQACQMMIANATAFNGVKRTLSYKLLIRATQPSALGEPGVRRRLTTYTEPICRHGHAWGAESLANPLASPAAPNPMILGDFMKKAIFLSLFLFACREGGQASAKPIQASPHQVLPSSPPAAEAIAPRAGSSDERRRTEMAKAAVGDLFLEACSLTFKPSSDAAPITTKIDLPEPCQFAKDKSGAAQMVKTDRGPTFLIVTSRPKGNDCDTRARAVVIGTTGLLVSTKEKRFASCSTVAMDAMMFHVLAASSVPAP